MANTEKKNKHMTLDDRIEIQECLNKGMTFKAIAKRISKDPTTVSKEVKLHGQTYANSFTKTDECCPLLLKAPFVCNGCPKRTHSNCKYPRRKYEAKKAQSEYEAVLTESREGIPLTKEEFYRTEQIISSAVLSGQNIYHAIKANNLSVSKNNSVPAYRVRILHNLKDRPAACRKIQAEKSNQRGICPKRRQNRQII